MSSITLGAFSVSLAVKDIYASKIFYEKIGFAVTGGNIDQKWLILKNGEAVIGLFQGMFDKNILTFNPGWNQHAAMLDNFDDVRTIQEYFKAAGIVLESEADPSTSGPAHISLKDPDGNAILIDQHR